MMEGPRVVWWDRPSLFVGCHSGLWVDRRQKAIVCPTSGVNRNETLGASVWNRTRAIVWGICPGVVGTHGCPAGAAGIPIIGVAAETLVEFAVLSQFLAIERDAETGSIRHADGAVFVAHEAALNDVVRQVMVVGVGGEREVGDDGSQVQHGGQLNAEFAGGVDGDTELEGLADGGGFHAGAYAAPECGVEQNHVDRGIEDIGGELFEVDHHGIGGQRHAHLFAGAAHAGEAVDRIFQVIVAQALNGLAETDGLFGGPDGIGVEAVGVARQFTGESAIGFEFVILGKHAGLHLVTGEAKAAFQGASIFQHLVDGADLALSGGGVGVTEEAVGGKRDAVAQASAEDLGDRHAPGLSENVEAGEFQRGQNLRAIVVKGRGGIGDEEAHLLEAGGVVPHQIRFHGAERRLGRFAAATHFAQPDDAVIGLHFDDGADEPSPVAAIGVAQRGLERHRDRGGADIPDLHILFHGTTIFSTGTANKEREVMLKEQWEIFKRAARREKMDKVPMALIVDSPWIPGYLGIKHLDYFLDPELWFESNLKIMREFPNIIFIPSWWMEYGMAAEPSVLGSKIKFWQDNTPSEYHTLYRLEDIDNFPEYEVEADGFAALTLHRIGMARQRILDHGYILPMITARGPLCTAGFVRGTPNFMIDRVENPEGAHKLIDLCTRVVIDWLKAQHKAMGDTVESIFILDDIVGFINEEHYMEFAHPYLKRICDAFPKDWVKLYHNDAEVDACLDHLPDAGFNVLNWGKQRQITEVKRRIGDRMCLMSNVNPLEIAVRGTPDEVKDETLEVLEGSGGEGIILSVGGGVSPGMPRENILAMLEALEEFNGKRAGAAVASGR